MKDIFNDPSFDKFLYGGVHDLENGVGPIIYSLYKIQDTNPIRFSCSGHLGSYAERDWKIPSNRKGYIVTCNSYIHLDIRSSLQNIQNMIKESVDDCSFASLKTQLSKSKLNSIFNDLEESTNNSEDKNVNTYNLELTFLGLVEPITKAEEEYFQNLEKSLERNIFSSFSNLTKPNLKSRLTEVEISLAKKRHEEMFKFWENLNKKLSIFNPN